MKKKYKVLLLIVINLILLSLINLFSSNGSGGGGNGNPALIFIIPLIPLAFWNAYELYKWIKTLTIPLLLKTVLPLLILIYFILGFKYQISIYNAIPQNIIEGLQTRGIPIDYDYIEDVTTGLTTFTNTVYFNYNTFFMFLSLIVLLSIVIPLIITVIKR